MWVFLRLVPKLSDRYTEQRINIKFCVELGKIQVTLVQCSPEAYGGKAMKESSVFEWHKHFKDGRDNVEDDEKWSSKISQNR